MFRIHDLIECVKAGRYRVSDHADEEAQEDGLLISEITRSLEHGEIIEEYLDDFPYPSVLLLSYNEKGEPIHSVWAYNRASRFAVLVTVYRPDSARWEAWKKRKK